MATLTRDEQLKAFLATRGVTQCPPTTSHADNAPSLRRLRDSRERMLTRGEEPSMEQVAERRVERFHIARAGGASVSEALDEANRGT